MTKSSYTNIARNATSFMIIKQWNKNKEPTYTLCSYVKKYDSESEKPNISRRMQSAASIYHGTALLNTVLTSARCLTNEVTTPPCRCLTDGPMTRIEINKVISTEWLRTNVAPAQNKRCSLERECE
jgi:hypothetical protein